MPIKNPKAYSFLYPTPALVALMGHQRSWPPGCIY